MARVAHKSIESQWYSSGTSLLDNVLAGKANPVFSRDTNVHPAFGVEPKIKRNVQLVNSVYRQTQGYMLIGDRIQETMSDPLHRPARYVLQQFRENNSGLGRARGHIRPAAPLQVSWKQPYYRMQRPPYIRGIGPYTQGQLQQQSVLYRINHWLRGGNTSQ